MAASRQLIGLLNDSRTISALDEHYKRVVRQLIQTLGEGVSRPGGARVTELLRTLREKAVALDPARDSFVRRWIKTNIAKAFVLGDRAATRQLREALQDLSAGERASFGDVSKTFTAVNSTAMKGIAAAMDQTMRRVHGDLLRKLNLVVRETQVTLVSSQAIRDVTTGGILRGVAGRKVADDIAAMILKRSTNPELKKRLRDVGFQPRQLTDFENVARGQVIQAGSKTMKVRDYANLVARTQMREAHKVGTIVRLQQNGIDHVQVSRHPQERKDECTPYAGKVFYIGALPKDPLGFPPLSGTVNGGPPFHPNCRHVLRPFVVPFQTEKAVEKAKESATALPRRFYGKTAKEVRELVAELDDRELEAIAQEGFEDIAA